MAYGDNFEGEKSHLSLENAPFCNYLFILK
jgi:hypothetical protein